MTWSLYQGEKFLKPLTFSNGKSQEDVVKEILKAIKEENKIIFVHGICGTGKSAIALNIARKLGKASVVVPGKNLQSQYKKDYGEEKYLLKDNGEKLKISVMTGRNNHKCKFLEDNKNAIPKIKKEINSKLHDIFKGKDEEVREMISQDISAENHNIPCKIEIKDKNLVRIKRYLKQNDKVKSTDFSSIKDVKRMSVAPVCPYWSPVMPEKYELNFSKAKKRTYTGIGGEFTFYQRASGCKFYEQFNSYIDSDVIVFNSLKYKYETILGRKPLTEVEIIDECDEFLDSFANQRNLNIDRLQNSLAQVVGVSRETYQHIDELQGIIKYIKKNQRFHKAAENGEIIPLKETGIYDLFGVYMRHSEFVEEIDPESYVYEVYGIVRTFDEFLDDTYVSVGRNDNSLIASLVTTNLEKKFKEMVDKNKIIVLMSGTLHSAEVLEKIFGLRDFKLIEAETGQQGRIKIEKTGLEMDCRYSNFSSGKFSREDYLKALDKCVESSVKPTLVHVNAFADLPTRDELRNLDIKNLISKDELRDIQNENKNGELIERFKKGEVDVLFSTRASRGIDFPGDECKSIIFTKYPNPNVQDAFWKILNKTNPNDYWSFYKDKAKRELWQKIYRGLRFKEDSVFLLSPDIRVLEAFEEK
jgi:Rad3-related DNA helicase